jgi:hypothetical protein
MAGNGIWQWKDLPLETNWKHMVRPLGRVILVPDPLITSGSTSKRPKERLAMPNAVRRHGGPMDPEDLILLVTRSMPYGKYKDG